MMLFFPCVFFTTYIYGTLLSMALSMASIYCLIRFLNRKNMVINAVGVVVFCTMASLAKNNAIIFAIAEIIVIFLSFKKEDLFKGILIKVGLILSIMLLLFLSSKAVDVGLKRYTGRDEVGTPKISWVAMGLQSGGPAEGWYNFYNRDVYWDNNCDTKIAKSLALESVKESLCDYFHHPLNAWKFFSRKIISSWANPSFETLNLLQQSNSNNPNTEMKRNLLKSFILWHSADKSVDRTHVGLNIYLKIYELAILFGAIVMLFMKRLNSSNCVFIIAFIGGFLFHLFWETGSQYMFTYFVILIPYGVYGISLLNEGKTANKKG